MDKRKIKVVARNRNKKSVPSLLLMGNYLSENGYNINQELEIEIFKDRIVVYKKVKSAN